MFQLPPTLIDRRCKSGCFRNKTNCFVVGKDLCDLTFNPERRKVLSPDTTTTTTTQQTPPGLNLLHEMLNNLSFVLSRSMLFRITTHGWLFCDDSISFEEEKRTRSTLHCRKLTFDILLGRKFENLILMFVLGRLSPTQKLYESRRSRARDVNC